MLIGFVQPAAVFTARYLLLRRAQHRITNELLLRPPARCESLTKKHLVQCLHHQENIILFPSRSYTPVAARPYQTLPSASSLSQGGCRSGCRRGTGSISFRSRAVEEGGGLGRFGRESRGARGGEGSRRASRQAPARGKGVRDMVWLQPANRVGRQYASV